jgi:hypothetical protein
MPILQEKAVLNLQYSLIVAKLWHHYMTSYISCIIVEKRESLTVRFPMESISQLRFHKSPDESLNDVVVKQKKVEFLGEAIAYVIPVINAALLCYS